MQLKNKDPYFLDPVFERHVLALACQVPNFYATVAYALDIDCMALPEAKPILETLSMMVRERGSAPASTVLVLQRMRRRMSEGKLTLDVLQAVSDLFDTAEEEGLLDPQAVAAELTPVLKRRLQSEAIHLSHDEYARKGNFKTVVQKLEQADRLGLQTSTVGTLLMGEGFSELDALSQLQRLPTGVLELDSQLHEGLARGGLGVALADSGGGKSMFLNHQACEAMRRKLPVLYATLELPKPVILARLYSNLTGVPVNQILENPQDRKEAERRLGEMAPEMGPCIVEEFPPHATTVKDLQEWASRCEQAFGREVGLVVVDYADKLYEPKMKHDNEYLVMRYVYEGLRRDLAVSKHVWVWTASQATRPSKESNKRLDLHHVSDSMHKVRVADLILTLNAQDDNAQVTLFVAKNRLGKSRMSAGPIPTDYERARLVPLSKEFKDWGQP